jgi:hypothetical protein
MRRLLSIVIGLGLLLPTSALAEFPTSLTRMVRHIPRTESELAAAFAETADNACSAVPAGESLELLDFTAGPSRSVDFGEGPQTVMFEACRRGVLSFGLDITPDDQQDLPFLSGGKILECVTANYVCIQARLQRAADGAAFLDHRPVAAVGAYTDPQQSQAFLAMMEESIKDVRGLGLFVKPDTAPTAETLRTLVVLHRNRIPASDPRGPADQYEFLFVRAQADDASAAGAIRLHAFATSEARQRLHFLRPYAAPSKVDECSIKSLIYFTEYGLAGLYPIARAVRGTLVRSQSSYSLDELDRYAASQHLAGGAWNNLTETLDAVIAGRVGKDPPPAAD